MGQLQLAILADDEPAKAMMNLPAVASTVIARLNSWSVEVGMPRVVGGRMA